MITAAEANGFRQLLQLQSPPRGPPSRVLSSRLRRCPQRYHPLTASILSGPSLQEPSSSIPSPSKRFYRLSRASGAPPPLSSSHDILGSLLRAIQLQNPTKILAELAALGQHVKVDEVASSLSRLPTPVFSELVRSLDPLRVGPKADVAYGLQVSPGLRQYSYLASVVNQFGIRKVYQTTLVLLRSVLELRLQHGRNLTLSDYVVLLRCAGAASDIEAAKWIWKEAMNPNGQLANLREGLAYSEFLKARFLTEPLYMQHDLARFRLRPRDLAGYRKRFANKALLRPLERLRLGIFANKRTSYGRSPSQPTHDLHRIISSRRPLARIWTKIRKSRVIIDQEMISTYLVARARTGSFRRMIEILWRWKIRITDFKDHRAAKIIGGSDQEGLGPLQKPTPGLLNAIVQAFGTTGHVILAQKLLVFFSGRYNIQISPAIWSSLLEWTYVASSKPASTEWKILGDSNRIIRASDVISLWDTMNAELSQESISMKDRDVYVKSMISAGKLDGAWEEIRRGCASYEVACEEVETALFERLHPSPPPEAIARHLRAKAKQHITWYTIQRWCKLWLKRGSKAHRDKDQFASIIVTEFVAEFKDFLSNPVTYQTSGGTVRITDHGNIRRHSWTQQIVRSPPTFLRVRDSSRPKFTKIELKDQGEDGEEGEVMVPVVTESGEQVYEKMPILLRRWTKRNVRRRTQKVFGQLEKKLSTPIGRQSDASQSSSARKKTRQPQSGTLQRGSVMRSLVW